MCPAKTSVMAIISYAWAVMSAVRLGYKNEAKTTPKFELRLLTGYVTGYVTG